MKNLKKFLAVFALGASTIIGCDSEPPIDETPGPDGAALVQKIKDNREANTQVFDVDLGSTTGVTIEGEQGSLFTFYYGNISDLDGNLVDGVIQVELLEVYDKSHMVIFNRSTMGLLPDGDHAALKTGGQFHLSASKDGEPLVISGVVKMMLPVDNTGGEDLGMTLFLDPYDDDDCDGVSIVCPGDVWEEVDSIAGGQGGGLNLEGAGGVIYYSAFITNFGWTNVDRFMSNPAPKTTLKAKAPAGYDQTNCAVYLSFDGEENSLATLDVFLSGEDVFTEHYGQIPIGMNVHLICVSIVAGDYNYSITPATITAGSTIVLNALTPTTEASLVAAINSLP